MTKRLLTTDAVCDRTGRKKSWVYKHVKLGNFPRPIRPGLWLESDVEAYIDRLIAQRDQAVAVMDAAKGNARAATLAQKIIATDLHSSGGPDA